MSRSIQTARISRRGFAAGVAATLLALGAAAGLAPAVYAQDKAEIRMATYTVSETWDAMIQEMIDAFNAKARWPRSRLSSGLARSTGTSCKPSTPAARLPTSRSTRATGWCPAPRAGCSSTSSPWSSATAWT